MDAILSYLYANADNAHWILFSLLMLAGLNIPISEDIILLSGGAIAGLYIPDHTLRLFLWLYMGCLLSGWEAYWMGRLLGPKLYDVNFFKHVITRERMAKLKSYYDHYGIYTFIVGRFIPGGVRNALFMSSGLTKMPFPLFILRDGIALILSTSILFGIGYYFGSNIDAIVANFRLYSTVFLITFVLLICSILSYIGYKRYQEQ